MGGARIESELLEEISHRLDLREPNRQAIRSVVLSTSQHYDVEQKPAPFECIVDSATGVGKTYVIAGLIEYFAGAAHPARNFLLLAPGRTIRDKSVHNFTPGHGKSLTSGMKSRPLVVTADNFNSPATRKAMADPSVNKLYIFTVQALTSREGEGRATHEYQEHLGGSFYNYLAQMDDLVVLADEHHTYRGPAFSRTIRELRPELVVGLTATPAGSDQGLVVYRYPLAAAIADELVKTPVMVGRRDDRNDTETKLLDGVTLLKYKERVAQAYCAENDLPPVHPVMLVIARSIEEAEEFQSVLDSVSFDGGAWVGKTLLVHSRLTGDAKERALQQLQDVEDPSSQTRIIISVGMLKEGWDVKNVYVIASMRASVSEVLTEQTLGRGMRLPFGRYTGVELLDTVEVLAHEKYNELLAKRHVLNEAFIDYGTYAEVRHLQDGSTVVRQRTTEAQAEVFAVPEPVAEVSEHAPEPEASGQRTMPSARPGMVDLGTRTGQAARQARQTSRAHQYAPLPGRHPIVVPHLVSVPKPASVSLNDIDEDRYVRFANLGKALTADYSDELRRTKLTATRTGSGITMGTETARDTITSALPLDIPLEESRRALVRRVMAVKGVQNRPLEVGAAQRIVDHMIEAMGSEAGMHLSAFGDRAGQRLAAEVTHALKEASVGQVTYEDEVKLIELNKVREATKEQLAGHPDGGFEPNVAFDGWRANLYSHAWFDSTPEYEAAAAIDASPKVVAWARLHRGDIPITWTAEGRTYNPDFVVIEDHNGQEVAWLVETKADREMSSEEVIAKRRAARRWAMTVNSSPDVAAKWGYILLSEQDVEDAQGSWEQMKGFGQ